ncbi:cell wall-active antibiotics response protein [Actinoplanes bogorensis]|uniref:Cell wall-active antibiotics response protein n=1 Tax=Paractinoplanes bogorensis TaxID=1610840 RepID=A0ABS5YL04_9ACTN|nr:LiaF domain-containing protein [Actinoplanes bogorensis]MBU2664152.1 cell wall-active antibiotics response protein [Actinoplanes bogorensis]
MDATDKPGFTGRDGAAWYFSLLGGIKRRGAWRLPRDMRMVGVLGGLNLDLTEATIPPDPIITKVSPIGGVSLRVPDGVSVEVEGLRLFGGVRTEAVRSAGAAVTLRVREYSLAGGVHVRRG